MANVVNSFEIAGCLKAAAAIEADIRQLATAVTEAQFHAPAGDGGWSVGYCVEHLVLTGRAYLPKWDAASHSGGKTQSPGGAMIRYGWWQRRILQCAENPSRLRHKTAPAFVPYARYSIEETISR